MSIRTLDDIIEELADLIGIYGVDRSHWTANLKEQIRDAVEVEEVIEAHRTAKIKEENE